MKTNTPEKPTEKTSVRVQLLATIDRRASDLMPLSGQSKPQIIAAAAVLGMPLLEKQYAKRN